MNVLLDFIVGLGLEVVKDKIVDCASEMQVKNRIKEFLKSQQSYNLTVSLDEEIDFWGLSQYIVSDLIDDVKQRCYGDSKVRGAARERIREKAVSYAAAHTKLSEERTLEIVNSTVEILVEFFRSKTNKELLFVTREIEDTVKEEHVETRALISKEAQNLVNVMRDREPLSMDAIMTQAENGNIDIVEQKFKNAMEAISCKHELYPYFGFRMTPENKLISTPLLEEAKTKFPPKFTIETSKVRVGNQQVSNIGKDVFSQSYRHQLPIYLDVKKASKYLGDVLDPVQSEAEEMIGTEVVVTPPEFPASFPCNVCMKSETIVPYLLLRTKEILDDGTIIITNEEQKEFHFLITFSIFKDKNFLTFTVQPRNATNKEFLHYRQFLQKAMSGEVVTVNALERNERIIQGSVDNADIDDLDEQIKFLQKIVSIEDYFGERIDIPEIITYGDYEVINHLYDLIEGGYEGESSEFTFTFVLEDETRDRILELTDSKYVIAYSADATFTVFEHKLLLPVWRQIEGVVIENLAHLKEKVKVLDNGDDIKVVFKSSGEKNKCKYSDKIVFDTMNKNLFYAKMR